MTSPKEFPHREYLGLSVLLGMQGTQSVRESATVGPHSHGMVTGIRCLLAFAGTRDPFIYDKGRTRLPCSPGTSLVFSSLKPACSMMILQRLHGSCGTAGQAHLFLHENEVSSLTLAGALSVWRGQRTMPSVSENEPLPL